MAKTDMAKPIYIGFKLAENQYHIFHAISWKVRTEYRIKLEAGKPTCGCALFRFDGGCDHAALVERDATVFAGAWGDDDLDVDAFRWQAEDPYAFVAFFDKAGDRFGVLRPNVGNLSLEEALSLLSNGTIPAGADTDGVLNPNRLYAEAVESFDKGIDVSHRDVVEAGEGADEPVATDTADDDADDFEEDVVDAPAVDTPAEEPKPETKSEPKPKAKADLPIWRRVKRPNPNQFFVDKDVWEQLLYSMCNGGNVLLIGESGSGKSELCYIATKALHRELAKIAEAITDDSEPENVEPLDPYNCGAMSEPRTALIGNVKLRGDKTEFEPARFAKSVQRDGAAILLDEITRAERGAFNILLPLLDRQGYLPLDEDEGGGVVKRGEKVTFLATANLGMIYGGTDELDKALKDRFDTVIALDFPPADAEAKVLLGRCEGLTRADADRLVEIATTQRRLAVDGDFAGGEQISTRMLLNAGEKIGAGMSFNAACRFSIANAFSDMGGETSDRAKIQQIIQKGDVGESSGF